MRNIFTKSSLMVLLSLTPAFADNEQPNIAVGTNPAECNETVLETTSGTSNLEANWNANTLYLSWSVDGTPYATNDTNAEKCTYDQGITIPTNPTKTGYTFAGWRVVSAAAPAQTPFDLTTLTNDLNPISYATKEAEGRCYANDTSHNEITTCSTPVFNDLQIGEWKTGFNFGTIKGTTYCSAKTGNNNNQKWNNASSNWTATDSELANAVGTANNCWCKVTSFTPSNGSAQNVTNERWVFMGEDEFCSGNCVYSCSYMGNGSDFYRAIFGVSE